MVYMDNAATTLQKPPAVGQALGEALAGFGGAGRSFHGPSLLAARAVEGARESVARLAGLASPRSVAFTSGATESLNLAIRSLIQPGDGVISTVLEHNSVLRPLYAAGCDVEWLDCDDTGSLRLEDMARRLGANTKWVVCTHGSNVLGTITNIQAVAGFCRAHGLRLLLDAAQTMGAFTPGVKLADLVCFTGHKGLYGPQGTGGILCQTRLPWQVPKTGGTGHNSFAHSQRATMPQVYEAGTPNAHGLHALRAGVDFLLEIGPEAVRKQEEALTQQFLLGVSGCQGVTVYGPKAGVSRLPLVSLNLREYSSEDAALLLWERWGIATRPGSHCAPLAHRRFGTEQRGMVRFSFSCFNTVDEIDLAVGAVRTLAKER